MSAPGVAAEDDEHRWIEAVEWHALRCDEAQLTSVQRAAWQLWWQDADNQRIYAACARLHADAQHFDAAYLPRAGRPEQQPSRLPGILTTPWCRALTRVVQLAIVALCATLAGPVARLAPRTLSSSAPPRKSRYQTGPAQTRRVTLSDGSTVILGAETSLTASLSATRRTVRLKRGEAWFHVVHHRHWPFVVRAGNGRITDLGTAFVVDREPRRVEVTVTQGQVEVDLADSDAHRTQALPSKPIRLRRGERLTYGPDAVHHVRAVNPSLALAWTAGELAFSDESLRDVVANVNRYTSRPIEVSHAAGQLRLTTLVMSRRIPAWLEGLGRVLPVRVTRSDGTICIQLRADQMTHLHNSCSRR